MMWTQKDDTWRLSAPPLEATFDARNSAAGITKLRFDNNPLSIESLLQCHNASAGTEIEDSLIDHYVREDDLVATYLQSPAKDNRKQIYLRPAGFLYPEKVCGVELVFSMQTQLLDADPQLILRSEFECVQLFALINPASPTWRELALPDDALDLPAVEYCGVFAAKLADSDVTYAQVIDPADYSGGRLIRTSESSPRFLISQPVFCASLEKGVIRRGRVTGLFSTAPNVLDEVARFHHWYRAAPPPLTT